MTKKHTNHRDRQFGSSEQVPGLPVLHCGLTFKTHRPTPLDTTREREYMNTKESERAYLRHLYEVNTALSHLARRELSQLRLRRPVQNGYATIHDENEPTDWEEVPYTRELDLLTHYGYPVFDDARKVEKYYRDTHPTRLYGLIYAYDINKNHAEIPDVPKNQFLRYDWQHGIHKLFWQRPRSPDRTIPRSHNTGDTYLQGLNITPPPSGTAGRTRDNPIRTLPSPPDTGIYLTGGYIDWGRESSSYTLLIVSKTTYAIWATLPRVTTMIYVPDTYRPQGCYAVGGWAPRPTPPHMELEGRRRGQIGAHTGCDHQHYLGPRQRTENWMWRPTSALSPRTWDKERIPVRPYPITTDTHRGGTQETRHHTGLTPRSDTDAQDPSRKGHRLQPTPTGFTQPVWDPNTDQYWQRQPDSRREPFLGPLHQHQQPPKTWDFELDDWSETYQPPDTVDTRLPPRHDSFGTGAQVTSWPQEAPRQDILAGPTTTWGLDRSPLRPLRYNTHDLDWWQARWGALEFQHPRLSQWGALAAATPADYHHQEWTKEPTTTSAPDRTD